MRAAFSAGAVGRGVPEATADAVFAQLTAFGGYAFPRSHAAAFAVIVYQSAWCKYHHPAAFLVGLLHHQPMGFWPPTTLVADARRHGVTVHGLHVAHSAAASTLGDDDSVQLGLTSLLGLGTTGAARILDARAARPFAGLDDLCRRTRLPRSIVI